MHDLPGFLAGSTQDSNLDSLQIPFCYSCMITQDSALNFIDNKIMVIIYVMNAQ